MEFKWIDLEVPQFPLVLRVPNIPGQDIKRMDKMPWQMKHQRKTLHATSDAKHVKQLQESIQVAKDRRLIEPM